MAVISDRKMTFLKRIDTLNVKKQHFLDKVLDLYIIQSVQDWPSLSQYISILDMECT